MKDTAIDARGERMLELLANGASNRDVAVQMGYQEGTMRVYLHYLYRKIGVANRTEAVVWYLRRGIAPPVPILENGVRDNNSEDLFGDMALQEDLFTALGVMSAFVGPYSKVWDVSSRLKGDEIDPATRSRRERSRRLWRALLKGDWSYGKRLYDADMGAALLVDAPSDAVLLASLLLLGGFSGAAERVIAQLTHRRKSGSSASPREAALVQALREALDGNVARLAHLRELSGSKTTTPVLKQVAMAVLFHADAARKDLDGARATANALWGEAEAARQNLQAMGERPFGGTRSTQSTAKAGAKRAGAREKATAR